MQGDADIIEILNDVLTAELTAINQYFIHAKLCGHWGFSRLAAHVKAESIDEMRHADQLIERILFLDGMPNLQRLYSVQVGENVREQFTLDLELEKVARDRLNRGIAVCVAKGDNASRALLEGILVSEEEHADWLETQLDAMDRVGDQNYLAQQLY
jgi:bacterioferritin